jgi:uncharacterized protein YgbK (DUF1537 family)
MLRKAWCIGRAPIGVAGGETSGAVVDRPAIPGFLVGAEIAAGVAFLRSAGAHKSEMLLALRSGNFAGPDFFRRARADALIVLRHSFPDDFCSRP